MRKYTNKKTGFTLLETVVAMAIFSVVVLTILGIFSKMIQTQYEIYDMQSLQNNARYLMEVFSKEARMAQIDSSGTCISSGKTFFTADYPGGSSALNFLNYKGECVEYKFVLTEKKIYKTVLGKSSVSMISGDIEAESGKFSASDDISSGIQPLVSFRFVLKNPNYEDESKKIKTQTTISARVYP